MSTPSDAPTNSPPIKHRRPLNRGWAKVKLIRELAQMEKTQTQLAAEYGVTQGAISQFANKHKAEIDAVKADIENELAGLWIAEKKNRIAEYQADVELLTASVGDELTEGKEASEAFLLRIKASLLKSVADELGDIPAKVNVNVTQKITYSVEGVDLANLH